MRGKKAKRLRRRVFGRFSQRSVEDRKYAQLIQKKGCTLVLNPTTELRFTYQLLKRTV